MGFLRILLLPFSLIWAFVTELRNTLYDGGILKSRHGKVPSAAIGNLSAGGTGKSPHSLFIARLIGKTKKAAILSRGYGRKTKGYVLVSENSGAEQVGDEPLMLKRQAPDLTVAVCENRLCGIEKLAGKQGAVCVVLDDAFQHRSLKADCYILLSRFDAPFFWDTVLPAGNLRELPANAKRADVIIITKCPDEDEVEKRREAYEKLIRRYSPAPVLYSRYGYKKLPESKNILLVSAVANPDDIMEKLKGNGAKVSSLKFADHRNFGEKQIKKIRQEFINLQGEDKIIATTEKDFVKLKGKLGLPVFCLEIEVEMSKQDEQTLENIIKNKITT